MNTMIDGNAITFKELEQRVFKDICKIGQDCTREFLKQYDRTLMETCKMDLYTGHGME